MINKITEESKKWVAPEVPEDIPHGDMPGDKVDINEGHILKANAIFPELLNQMKEILRDEKQEKVVVTVCGGSGVGKSEIASLLSYYLEDMGIGSYTLSGDNYPHRIPEYNDAERLRIFRTSGIEGMLEKDVYTKEHFNFVNKLQVQNEDASSLYQANNPWFEYYIDYGKKGLEQYLGSDSEIDFHKVTQIAESFKRGERSIWLKRMGRSTTEMWYDDVDFSAVQVLIIEWTHGNSDNFQGVDIPILLNSTPEETLAHRKARNRDGAIDSPFTTLVLEIEQEMLKRQAHKAKMIVTKGGEIIDYNQYCCLMENS